MRKKLSVVQILAILICALLPMLDGMFTWIAYNMYENLSKTPMSLSNLMTVQRIGAGPFVYWLFYISLAVMLLYCVLELFFEDKVGGHRAVIAVPVISLILGILMILTADGHTDTFLWKGETRHVAVTVGVLAYVLVVLLIAIPIIECYKQYKCEK